MKETGTQTAWPVGCWSRNQSDQQEAASAERKYSKADGVFVAFVLLSLSPLLASSGDAIKRGTNASEGRDC